MRISVFRQRVLCLIVGCLSFGGLAADAVSLRMYDERASLPDQSWTAPVEHVEHITGLGLIPQGMQWTPLPAVHLHMGYRSSHLHDEKPMAGLAAGMEIPCRTAILSYAFTPAGKMGLTHGLSLIIHFR